MKTAIILCDAVYSPTYKKNRYTNVDLFACTIEPLPDKSEFKDSIIVSPIEQSMLLTEQQDYQNHYIAYCQEMLNRHAKYDIYIYTTFRTILDTMPNIEGVYRTSVYGSIRNELNSYQLVSDTHVRINGVALESVYKMDVNLKRSIYTKLYGNRVLLFDKSLSLPEAEINVFIPSVVNVSSNSFDYVDYRSVFTPKERFEQTVNQVRSIYEKNSNVHTYLLEGSQLTFDQLDQLTPYCTVILFYNDSRGNEYANKNKNKSLYEIYVMSSMLSITKAKWSFKFGGRYVLSTYFDFANFLLDKPVVKTIDAKYTYTGNSIVECILYSIPKQHYNHFIDVFNCMLIRDETVPNSINIEKGLFDNLRDYYKINHLYLHGKDAIEGLQKFV